MVFFFRYILSFFSSWLICSVDIPTWSVAIPHLLLNSYSVSLLYSCLLFQLLYSFGELLPFPYSYEIIYYWREWDMLSFLRSLIGMLRSSNAVAVVTFPPTLLSPSSSTRWQHMADTLLSVKAIPGLYQLSH